MPIPALVALPVAACLLAFLTLELLGWWGAQSRRRELERWLGEQRIAWARVPAPPHLRRP
jgi:hypothetical protein